VEVAVEVAAFRLGASHSSGWNERWGSGLLSRTLRVAHISGASGMAAPANHLGSTSDAFAMGAAVF
jgi:hypothetical protein